MTRTISEEFRRRVVVAHQAGKVYNIISEESEHHSTVYRWIFNTIVIQPNKDHTKSMEPQANIWETKDLSQWLISMFVSPPFSLWFSSSSSFPSLFCIFFFHSVLQISGVEVVIFLLHYNSNKLYDQEKIVIMGDCCYVNPMVRRTFRFLGNWSTNKD